MDIGLNGITGEGRRRRRTPGVSSHIKQALICFISHLGSDSIPIKKLFWMRV